MTKTKSTKRALLGSALALLICVSMLIGSTFAWFTDSATTGSNVIKSGKLDVVLEMEQGEDNWVSAEGLTLDWIKAEGTDEVLWEPGCTYQLPKLRIRNAGNLALKYQVQISGFEGDKELLDVIDFTLPQQDATESLLPDDSDEFIIEGHMQETAGNDYMNKTLTGISITVVATQFTYESDSYGNQYDDITIVSDADELKDAIAAGGNVVLANDISFDADDTITVAKGKSSVLDLNGKTISTVSDKIGSNRNAFDVRGTMTVANGFITTKHVGENMGWGNSTNVFNVTDGGVLNIENATIENLGGSDMAFVVHLNNWGEVTLNVNNSTLISNYTAVRVFNSGNHMNNVNITNSILMGGSQSFWVHNFTADDFGNDDAKVEAAAARLNFNFIVENPVNGVAADDTSNLVAEANNTFVGKIRYGFTNGAVYFQSAEKVVANSNTALKDAISNGAKEIYLSDGEYSLPTLENKEGITITGADGAVIGGENVENGFGSNFGQNNTFKNIVFYGTSTGVRWSYAQGGTIVFENCSFLGNNRGGFHIDAADGATLIFNNCTLSGFNAFAGTLEKVVLNGCTLPNNGKYNGLNMYCDLEMNDCKFEFTGVGSEFVDFEAAGQTLTINNCTATMNGVPMNIADKIGGTYVSDTAITIDGVAIVK